MTAFAAIVLKHGQTHDDGAAVAALSDLGDAVAAAGGRPASVQASGRCALVAAPLHRTDPCAPARLPSGVCVTGQILLEEPRHLAATLAMPWPANGAELVGCAYDRWGDGCADRLTGEYAFAVWDPREQTLVCARDGLGIRLLYVADTPHAIVVTNVIAAALRHPGVAYDLDEPALLAFLAHGGAADEVRTCYRGIRVLPPGHTLTLRGRDLAATTLRRHWRFPIGDGVHRTPDGILAEYRSVLADAVCDRLDDDGTSIFLSGGIDSTTMAAAAREVAPPRKLHAITVRYPRLVADAELPYARAAAEHLALPQTVLDADAHGPWYVDAADPPPSVPLDEPMLAEWRDTLACAAEHGTVSLYGEDGDALLRPPGWRGLRNSASLASIGLAAAQYAVSEKRRPYVGLRWRERIGRVSTAHRELPRWLTSEARAALESREPGTVLGLAPEPLVPHPTRPEAQGLLTSTTISRVFAATIAGETTRRRVELRFPLMDTRLMRFVVSIPAIPWCQQKLLPRRAYRGRLPESVLQRPKTPLAGFNEAYVAAWRGARPGPPAVSDRIGAWVDSRECARILEEGTSWDVMAAWRVSVLSSWLACIR